MVEGAAFRDASYMSSSEKMSNWELTAEDGAKRTVYGTVSLVEGGRSC